MSVHPRGSLLGSSAAAAWHVVVERACRPRFAAVAASPLALGATDSEAHSEAVGVAVSAPRGDADRGGEREAEEEPDAVASTLSVGAAEAEGRAREGET